MRRWIVILIVISIEIVASEKIVDIKTLTLTISQTSLNRDSNSTIKVEATYSDQTTQDVTDQIEWVIDNKDAVEIQDHTLTAKKDINTTLKAKLDNLTSNTITLNIYWEIDGHTLPPEPNKAINNSTLLGIDVNHNGVRDDVERWIYERFGKDSEYPKTKIAIAMQYAQATQKILETPTIESKKYLDDAIDCQYYWFSQKQKKEREEIYKVSDFKKGIEMSLKMGKWREKHKIFNDAKLKDKMLNTKIRIKRKFQFNEACSGHIFHGRSQTAQSCLYDIDSLGE